MLCILYMPIIFCVRHVNSDDGVLLTGPKAADAENDILYYSSRMQIRFYIIFVHSQSNSKYITALMTLDPDIFLQRRDGNTAWHKPECFTKPSCMKVLELYLGQFIKKKNHTIIFSLCAALTYSRHQLHPIKQGSLVIPHLLQLFPFSLRLVPCHILIPASFSSLPFL